jgi:hypothetical protein
MPAEDELFAKPPPPLGTLLNRLAVYQRRFVVLTKAQAHAGALWIAHTWTIDAAHATPYLHVTSAEPESGKTRQLEVLQEVVPRPLSTMNISDAALYRAIGSENPTLFLDELDAVFNSHTAKTGSRDELRSLLNAGYRRGQRVYRMGGANRTTLEAFDVFGAKAMAGLGSLPDTLASRCIRIELKRRRRDELVEDFIPSDLAGETAELRRDLQAWADNAVEALRKIPPTKIDGLRDRTNEVWRPLFGLATAADGRWPARAHRAAIELAGISTADEPSVGVLLLSDVRDVFAAESERLEEAVEAIATADLIALLARIEESPWGDWWIDPKEETPKKAAPRRLAKLLRPFGIRSRKLRLDGQTPGVHGYRRTDFLDAWGRFLPDPVSPKRSATSATSATNESHSQRDVADVAYVADFSEDANAAERLLLDANPQHIGNGSGPSGRREPPDLPPDAPAWERAHWARRGYPWCERHEKLTLVTHSSHGIEYLRCGCSRVPGVGGCEL